MAITWRRLAFKDEIGGSISRVNRTQADSPVTLSAGDCSGSTIFTNTGAAGETIFNLPAGFDGARINGIVTFMRALSFVAYGTETIRCLGIESKAGGKITSSAIDHQVQLDWNGSAWVASIFGPAWQLETS